MRLSLLFLFVLCRTLLGIDLTPSGAIKALTDGQVIENKHIVVDGEHGITIDGLTGVKIKNCLIEYTQGHNGITFQNSPKLEIWNCEIRLTDAPEKGKLQTFHSNCIQGLESDEPLIQNVKMTDGSSGVYLIRCDNAYLKNIQGHNFRGPFPRGQLLQYDRCTGGVMEYFSVLNDLEKSWPEDSINCYKSHGQTFRYGLVDGNNAPSGVGILWEDQNKEDSSEGETGLGGLVEDVDFVNMGNGAFSGADGAKYITFRRVRVRDNFLASKGGRGLPKSRALVASGYGHPGDYGEGLQIEDCQVYNLVRPNALYWPPESFTKAEITVGHFSPRQPIVHDFQWNTLPAKEAP